MMEAVQGTQLQPPVGARSISADSKENARSFTPNAFYLRIEEPLCLKVAVSGCSLQLNTNLVGCVKPMVVT